MDQIINAFKLAVQENYVNFSGRANKAEYWYFVLGSVILSVLINIIGAILPDTIGMVLSGALSLGIMLPSIGAAVRRLHDINKSGWFFLIALIPFGVFYLIYLLIQSSDQGPNQYGEPSKNLQ